MNRIFAALILSTAAIGTAQANEVGYVDNPGAQTQSSLSRAQVQNELNADRARARAFQGELNPAASQTEASTVRQASAGNAMVLAKGEAASPAVNGSIVFVNG